MKTISRPASYFKIATTVIAVMSKIEELFGHAATPSCLTAVLGIRS
jgi:hypothetical protein